jgi:hypothetical protein
MNEIIAEQREEMITLIRDSIERSISHNEIVPFTFYGDRESLLSVIKDLRDEDVEWVKDLRDEDVEWVEANGVVEVWGCHGVHEDIMLWRVHVECTD